ncbi:MAG: recombinase zinc beta ribbon domain-containing protein, partial [Pseudomonadota bacterium]
PKGYKYVKSKRGGKELVFDEELAPIVREALEGYAYGRFASQTEVRRFLERQPAYPKDMPNGGIRPQTIVRLLGKIVYAGYVEAPNWGIAARPGNHPGIISLDTYQKIQHRLNTPVYAAARKDVHLDFPLRGAAACSCCGKTLTAGWSRGKYDCFAYYRCRTKGCERFGKSIRKDQIESDFEKLLETVQPSRGALGMVQAMFQHCWDMLDEQAQALKGDVKKRIKQADKDIAALVDMAVNASSPTVLTAYEKKIEQIEHEKLALKEKLANPGRTGYSQTSLFELSMKFLASPCKVWSSGRYDLRQIVLRLVFSGPIHYCKEEGFLNTNFSMPFNMLGGKNMPILQNGAAGEN